MPKTRVPHTRSPRVATRLGKPAVIAVRNVPHAGRWDSWCSTSHDGIVVHLRL